MTRMHSAVQDELQARRDGDRDERDRQAGMHAVNDAHDRLRVLLAL
jgi:hypothetical protein